MTHVCACISRTHPHKPPSRHQAQEHTHSNTCAARSTPDREGNANKGCLCTPVPTLTQVHTCLHLGTFLCFFSTPAGLKNIHTDTYMSTVCQNTSVHTPMHTHPATPTPKYLQLIYKYIHTAVYTCAPIVTLYTRMNTHRAHLYAHTHKSIFTYALISQVHPGSHASPYPVNKTYIYKYM